jgi:hypothetical protein
MLKKEPSDFYHEILKMKAALMYNFNFNPEYLNNIDDDTFCEHVAQLSYMQYQLKKGN